MIRATICMLLIIGSTLTALPGFPVGLPDSNVLRPLLQPGAGSAGDPSGAKTAFNVTYTHFDIYTRANTTLASSAPNPPGNATWSSKFLNASGSPIPDTAFRYGLTPAPANTTFVQTINYTLNIPQGVNNSTDTFITFKWNGTLGNGTSARYRIFNGTGATPQLIFPAANVTKKGPGNFTGGANPKNATGIHPFSCSPTEECFRVTSFIGLQLTLMFSFVSSPSGGGINVDVDNVIVFSPRKDFSGATSHTMSLNPADRTEVLHTAQISLAYNSTITFTRPGSSTKIIHRWQQIAATFYRPSPYTLNSMSLNDTGVIPGQAPIAQGNCTMSGCTNSTFLSLEMTSNTSTNTTAAIDARSINPLDSLSIQPLIGGAPANSWMLGDTVSVQLRSHPGVNASGTQTIAINDPTNATQVTQAFSNKGGSYRYDLTQPLPLGAPLGSWNITATFLSGFDFGAESHQIVVDQLNVNTLSISGTAGQGGSVTVRGSVSHALGSASADGVNATVFIVDQGSPPGPISRPGTAPSGLYVSNITLVNGVFTPDQPLTAFFTVANPTPTVAFTANVTIEHVWYGGSGGSHGATATFALELGDQPFLASSFVYRMDVSLTASGVQITVQSKYKQEATLTLSAGTSGVPVGRQHSGSFKISVTSKSSSQATPTTNGLVSPAYAYVIQPTLIPSRLLAFNSTLTSTDGSFTATIPADRILGAKNLAVFTLIRDSNGIGVGQNQTLIVKDSTILTPIVDVPSEVTVGQQVALSFRIKNNSTRFPITLVVSLTVTNTATFVAKTFVIQPGATQTETFPFQAPGSAGSYLLVFSSQQYGPLLTKTLQVSILQGSLQLLIPAIIGLVVALVILGIYLIRRPSKAEVDDTKPRPGQGKGAKPQASRNP